jgi:hypothetical protein
MIRAYNLGIGLQWPSLWWAYTLRLFRRHRCPDRLDFRPNTSPSLYHTRMDFSLYLFHPPFGFFFQISSSFRSSTEIMQATYIHVCTT